MTGSQNVTWALKMVRKQQGMRHAFICVSHAIGKRHEPVYLRFNFYAAFLYVCKGSCIHNAVGTSTKFHACLNGANPLVVLQRILTSV